MSDSLDQIRADLRRHLEQQLEGGRRSVHLDPERRAAAAAAGISELPEPVADAPEDSAASAASAAVPAADNATRLADFDAVAVKNCTECKLHGGRTHTVFGVGNPQADLVLVGEAPGRDEDLQGEPFVGAAGQLLDKIMAAIGFTREDVYIANILKCRPPDNRDPEADEVAACLPKLRAQLEIIQPKLILALGRIAAQNLLQTNTALGRLRGQVHDFDGIPMMVTYHPAALLRNEAWKRPTWEDVQKLRALHDELVGGD